VPTKIAANVESKLKLCRLLVAVFLVTLPGMIRGVEQMVGRVIPPVKISLRLLIVITIGAIFLGFWARIQFVWPATRALRANPESGALPKWQVGQLAGAICAEWIGLLGMLWRSQGGSLRFASFFYAPAFALLSFWFPRRP